MGPVRHTQMHTRYTIRQPETRISGQFCPEEEEEEEDEREGEEEGEEEKEEKET